MKNMYLQIGIFTIALLLILVFQIYENSKKYRDCKLFARLLVATIGILTVDTIGWMIDGNPIGGQLWLTTVIDGIDLIMTSFVCWCWVQYAMSIVDEEEQASRKWYCDVATLLLIIQAVLVSSSQVFGIYYYIDDNGIYHRGDYYIFHSLISFVMLAYSSGACLRGYCREKDKEKKRELLYVASIIVIPVIGNLVQLVFYGYPTVWLCIVFMIMAVFVRIQNKRVNEEREEQNTALKKALAKAQLASAAKSEFFSRMSHDLRTPMNGILGTAYLAADMDDVRALKEGYRQVIQTGKYMLEVINDTLDVSKIESGRMTINPEPCDEEVLFANIIKMMQPAIEAKNINFRFTKKNIEWQWVLADAQRLQQLFTNLLSNAVKFTEKGGNISLFMECISNIDGIITDRFIVSDDGIGMSDEFQKHLFEPFMQEHRTEMEAVGGTGLGLAIVKQIVDLMGGNISVRSAVGKGTEVELLLRFSITDKREEKIVPTETADFAILSGKQVLLAEDHPLNAQIAIKLLEKLDCRVVLAKNGQECVDAYADSDIGQFDVILMDIRMPVMNGLEAAKAIRNMERKDALQVPIIAVTANAYDDDIKASLMAGMNSHLPKPINPKEMYSLIAAELNKRNNLVS